jgi:uncharacterized protein (TIGR02594 family)
MLFWRAVSGYIGSGVTQPIPGVRLNALPGEEIVISRRVFTASLVSSPLLFAARTHAIEEDTPVDTIEDLEYPSFDVIDPVKQFGASVPSEAAKAKAIWSGAPKGPKPIDVANYFIDNFAESDPDAISQWPRADAWNPLVVEFFRVTSYKAENDMVPWCAAFVNWCLKRTNRTGSGLAASQSFLDPKSFALTSNPSIGDVAVFTCYSKSTGKSVGLGHVAFVAAKPGATHVLLAGGNQGGNNRSMICRRPYPLNEVESSRRINGKKTPVTFKFNTYVTVI